MNPQICFPARYYACVCVFAVIGTAFAGVARAQQMIQVPGNASTVQAAIDMASNGDTVNIAPGTYNGPIDFKGKSITVQGSGPGVILKGYLSGPVVTFKSGETRSAILQNVTVTNGAGYYTPSAGGIFIEGSSPTIQNSTITGNQTCGIGVFNGAPAILNNEISNTTLAIYIMGCGAISFVGDEQGGGIFLLGAPSGGLQTQIIGNTIENNQVVWGAAGIDVTSGGLPLIENNIIRDNFSNDSGAGILVQGDTSPSIIQNLIYENTINPTLIPPALSEVGAGLNVSVSKGEFESVPVVVANNTIVGNQLLLFPGAVSLGSQFFALGQMQRILLYNNLIIGTTSQPPINCFQETPDDPVAPPSFYNNDVYDLGSPDAPVYSGACPNQTGISGNISADPHFATDATDAHPYELMLTSPAVDAGNNEAPALPSLDLLGQPRIQNAKGLSTAIVDMGVYEYAGVPGPLPPPANFTLEVSPGSATVQQGQNATFSVALTPSTANLGAVILGCTGLPANVTCSFAPSLLVFSSTGQQTSVLTVTTGTAVATTAGRHGVAGELTMVLAGIAWLPFAIGRKRRDGNRRLCGVSQLLGILCLLSFAWGLSGCGKDHYVVFTPPQTYSFAVQATAGNSGLSKQASVVLTVEHGVGNGR